MNPSQRLSGEEKTNNPLDDWCCACQGGTLKHDSLLQNLLKKNKNPVWAWSCSSKSVGWVETQSLPCCTMGSALTDGAVPVARLLRTCARLKAAVRGGWRCLTFTPPLRRRHRGAELARGDSKGQVQRLTSLGRSGAVWAALKPKNAFSEIWKVFWEVWMQNCPLQTHVVTEANKY